ncbi:hypothetical protein RAZWK3B_06852 [Roseobacter sp. AzwK-3b]|nr:hypothetical protein RAZWK3B_06852 [Roseobacter sp. AzwK-3b]
MRIILYEAAVMRRFYLI